MKKIFFSTAIISVVFFAASCKKEAIDQSLTTNNAQQRAAAAQKNCPEGSVFIGVSSVSLTGFIEMSWNNPCSTFKAIDITINRIETGGNRVLFMHQLLGRPGTGTLSADLVQLPANTIGFSYTIDCYRFDEVKGNPCSTIMGCKYLQ